MAYQSGLLKSLDPSATTITSKYHADDNYCHSSMRLAFRYVTTTTTTTTTTTRKQHMHKRNDDDDDDVDEEDLFLCWVDEHGMPFHFRRLRPRTTAKHASNDCRDVVNDDDDAQPNVTTAANNNTISGINSTLPMMVNESDHVEKTYPGHAFVFCRKIINNRNLRVGGGRGGEGGDGHVHRVKEDDDDGTSIVDVAHDNGKTYFLRKRRKRTKNGRDCNNTEDCYLVVGGYRLKPMKRDESHGDDEKEEEDNDDDDDDGDNDLYVQLVTITRLSARTNAHALSTNAITKPYHRTVTTTNPELDTDSYDDEEDGPTSSSWRTLCCACFPGTVNTKSHRTPAIFVASAISQVDLAASSLPRLPKYGNQIIPTVKNVEDDGDCMLDITVTLSRLDPTPIDTSSKHYDTVLLGDWPCRIEPGCFPSNMTNPITGQNVLQCRFESDILAASASLPDHARERLKKSTPIWINKSSCYGPKASPIIDRDACFHPGTEWLIKNGMNPAKRGGCEWYDAQHYLKDCDLWGPGGQVLHELSHAWHCLHIKGGYDNEEIINVYNLAMEEGLYDCVRVHDLQGKTKECKAYACSNPMEYFAELSVAFLGGVDKEAEHNKWYPFNRRQVHEHDPRAFDMLCRMWGVDENESVN